MLRYSCRRNVCGKPQVPRIFLTTGPLLQCMAILLTIFVTVAVVILLLTLHTPEKEIRHQVEHYHDILDPQFRREMGALLGPAIMPGNTIQALENGDEIFPQMLAAIAAAERTVTFETYIYWSGDVGNQFAAALTERA